MKTLILGSLAGLFSFLQTPAQNDPYKSVTDQMINTYNDKNYKGFYDLLSADFKAQQSEKDITGFLQNNLYAYYGAIKTINFVEQKAAFRYYKTECKKGDLGLLLACNEKNEISGFSFQPYQEKAALPSGAKKEILSDNKKQNAFELALDSLVAAYISNPANASLSIGLVKNGVTSFYHYGETKKGNARLPSNESMYEIGSISKTFTGILFAKAIEEHKVKADDDIRNYLPASCKNLVYKDTLITLLHLANHTSGIPRIPGNITAQKNFDEKDPYKNYTKELLFNDLAKTKIKTAPGTVTEYSNTGMALLGVILAGVYGKSYEALVKEKITEPWNMAHTFEKLPASETSVFCTGYDEKGHETPYWNFTDFAACGGLRSTGADMMLYLKSNISEKDPAVVLSHSPTFQSGKYNSVGMAWFMQESLSGEKLIWHNGGTYGFSSFMAFIKGKETGLVVLSNSGNSVDALSIQILKALKK